MACMSFIFFFSCVLLYHFFARSMTTRAHRGKRVSLLCAAHLALLCRVGQSPRRLSGIPQRWYNCDRHRKPRVSPCVLFFALFRMYLMSVLVAFKYCHFDLILCRSNGTTARVRTFYLPADPVRCQLLHWRSARASCRCWTCLWPRRLDGVAKHTSWRCGDTVAVALLSDARRRSPRQPHGPSTCVLKRLSRRHPLPPITHPLSPAALVRGRQQLSEGAGASASPPPARHSGAVPTTPPPVRPPGAVPTPARPTL